MKLEKNSKLLFIGDSVTDCGRQQPVGEGIFDGNYGNGYVNIVRALLAVDYADMNIRPVNMGTSGNNVLDLKARWETDVLAQKPDWVSVMIGINDIWRQFDSPLMPETHVTYEVYCVTLEELVAKTIDKVSGMVIMTPYFIEPRKDDPMRAMMDKYGAAAKTIAKKYGALIVDTQAVMDRLTQSIPTAAISWDRVHPNIKGHMALAKAFMETIA